MPGDVIGSRFSNPNEVEGGWNRATVRRDRNAEDGLVCFVGAGGRAGAGAWSGLCRVPYPGDAGDRQQQLLEIGVLVFDMEKGLVAVVVRPHVRVLGDDGRMLRLSCGTEHAAVAGARPVRSFEDPVRFIDEVQCKERLEIEYLLDTSPFNAPASMERFKKLQEATHKMAFTRFGFLVKIRELLGLERFQKLKEEFRRYKTKKWKQGKSRGRRDKTPAG